MMKVVVMGVSGSGKSSIGSALARRLGVPFVDADDLHPPANKLKMASGSPLVDADRWPWLDAVGAALAVEPSIVVACSALRLSYRDRLRAAAPDAVFVHLHGDDALLSERLGARSHEFMPTTLLGSQLATLEPLEPGETGFVVDIAPSPEEIVDEIVRQLPEEAAR